MQVTIKAGIAVPVTEGVADIIRSHKAFSLKSPELEAESSTGEELVEKPCDISIFGRELADGPADVLFGRVVAVFTVQAKDADVSANLLMVRWYESPEDSHRCPLGMRPLVWQEMHNAGVQQHNSKLRPVYGLVDMGAVLARLPCGAQLCTGQGSFFDQRPDQVDARRAAANCAGVGCAAEAGGAQTAQGQPSG
jgi:hypothetical protein